MVVLLFFTATVTPYEVCFFDEPDLHNEGPDAMWIVNRCIDTLFMIDIILTMNTMFERQTLEGPIWIGSRRLIIQNYLCASPWCVVDVVSVFPFYLLNYAMAAAADNGNSTTLTTTTSAESFSSLRMVKLLRMLKLARMFKAAAYFAPVVKDVIMVRLEMTYAALKVLELIMWLLLFTHLQACFWGLFSSLAEYDGQPTWINVYIQSYSAQWGHDPAPWEVYSAALYWSAMTVTSIGYGEMLPENSAERVACTFFMLASGMVWAYILSTAAGIAATLNPNNVLFHNTMDQLNYFMRERSLPRQLRHELRQYFETARKVREVSDDGNLLAAMSPLLQGRVAYAANQDWLVRIWYFQQLIDSRETREFIAIVAKALVVQALVAEERAPIGQLYVIRKGMCVKNWRFMRGGKVWGDDMIIDALHLMDHSQAVAITYVEVFILTRESLDSSAEGYPHALTVIDRAARRIRLQRALLIFFCERMGTKPKSFIRQKDASGYYFVTSQMSMDQKIDALHSAFVDDGHLRLSRSRRTAHSAAASQPSKALLGEARPKKLSEMLKMGHATFTADDSRELSSFTSPPKEPGERPRRFPAGASTPSPAGCSLGAASEGGAVPSRALPSTWPKGSDAGSFARAPAAKGALETALTKIPTPGGWFPWKAAAAPAVGTPSAAPPAPAEGGSSEALQAVAALDMRLQSAVNAITLRIDGLTEAIDAIGAHAYQQSERESAVFERLEAFMRQNSQGRAQVSGRARSGELSRSAFSA